MFAEPQMLGKAPTGKLVVSSPLCFTYNFSSLLFSFFHQQGSLFLGCLSLFHHLGSLFLDCLNFFPDLSSLTLGFLLNFLGQLIGFYYRLLKELLEILETFITL